MEKEDVFGPDTPVSRLALFAKYAKKMKLCRSYTDFERMCGLSPHYLNNVRFSSSTGNCSVEVVNKVHDVFPQLNIVWIVTGKGAMIVDAPQEGYREAYLELVKEVNKIKKIISGLQLGKL